MPKLLPREFERATGCCLLRDSLKIFGIFVDLEVPEEDSFEKCLAPPLIQPQLSTTAASFMRLPLFDFPSALLEDTRMVN
mmetsp:Transcript_52655/g.83524  ORF Transcript_52655/g.83524 Transcript_52655/m.83524 type:complete len:80 (+) Transcript_52655:613-852(+)